VAACVLVLPRHLFQEALGVLEISPQLTIFTKDLLPRPFNHSIFLPSADEHLPGSSRELGDLGVGRDLIEFRLGDLFGDFGTGANAHVREGAREAIGRRVSLQERILHVKPDAVVEVGVSQASGHRVVPHDLVDDHIWHPPEDGIRVSTPHAVRSPLLVGPESPADAVKVECVHGMIHGLRARLLPLPGGRPHRSAKHRLLQLRRLPVQLCYRPPELLGIKRRGPAVAADLAGIIANRMSQNVANGARDRQGVFTEQENRSDGISWTKSTRSRRLGSSKAYGLGLSAPL